MKKIIFIALGVYVLVSCKKDTSTTGGGPIYPSNATSYYAILTVEKYQSLFISSPTTIQTTYNLSAYFSSSPLVPFFSSDSTYVLVDSVKLNGVPIQHSAIGSYYFSYATINYPPVTWQVIGNHGIPSFTYTDNAAAPTYTNYNLLPDTVDHTKALILNINLTNSSDINVTVFDNNGNSTYQILPSGINSITFAPALMTQLSGAGNISITSTKNNVQNVYGKAMNFQSIYSFQKQIFIK